jgi:hypothetical protein
MICPYCNQSAKWVDNAEIYGKRYGKSYMMWWCKPCDALVGCHQNTQKALGTLANKELRQWRMAAHRCVDPLWKSGEMTRQSVYTWLKEKFGREIHMGEADIQTCKQIIRLVEYRQGYILGEIRQ